MKFTKKMMLCLISLLFIFAGFNIGLKADVIISENNSERRTYIENSQTYITNTGERKIYWAQGITAPKMTADESLLGTDGYFSVERLNGYETYQAEYAPGNGYFDYNKNLNDRYQEHPLCYLGASSNLISWWLNQNKQYVKEYVTRLKTTDIYGQLPGLYDVATYDEELWKKMYQPSGIEYQDGYLADKIGLTPLSKEILKPYYYKKDHGFYQDMVLDFFFNGYDAIPNPNYVDPNTPDNFVKDPRGGFFYPIFGKELLSQRLSSGAYNTYEFFDTNFKKFFNEGYGVSIAYEVNRNIAHAITIWGAEYDEKGHIARLFITDSDDYQAVKNTDKYWRGLVAVNVVKDKNGRVCITNNTNPNPDWPGNYISNIVLLDLAQDKFEQRLKETESPKEVKIEKDLTDMVYALGAKSKIFVNVSSLDGGDIFYQWYESTDKTSKGTKIKGATTNELPINADSIRTNYYYCEITNVKNGKEKIIESNHIKVDIKDIPLVNAEAPKIKFNYNTVSYNQYESPNNPLIKVDAKVSDGGVLTYQWYQAYDNSPNNGTLLKGETNPYFYPQTRYANDRLYFYCEITNTNYNVSGNPVTVVKTPYSKRVKVIANSLVDAKTPLIINQPTNYIYNQFEKAMPIIIDAKVFDGGTLSYKWYQVNSDDSVTQILNADKNIYIPKTNVPGIYKYKVEVINNNEFAPNNHQAKIYSNIITVEIKGDKPLSNDNLLENLEITNGTITPSFDKNVNNYDVKLKHGENVIDLIYQANPKATVKVSKPDIITSDNKIVTITVIAEDLTENIYTLTVTLDDTHEFGEWVVVKEATCTEEGLEKRTCSKCGKEETRSIPKLEHEFDTIWTIDIPATCTAPGEKSHHCKHCDARTEITVIEMINHNFGKWNVIKEATCTEDGLMEHTCKDCGYKEQIVVSKKGHSFNSEWTVDIPATCTAPGEKSHHCNDCDARTDITVIPPHGHNFSNWVVVKEATLTETGLERRTCNICGEIEERIIPVLENLPVEPKGCLDATVAILSQIIALGVLIFVFKRK